MSEKVGRNDLCPCGSGQKYKRCHGKDGPEPTVSASSAPPIVGASSTLSPHPSLPTAPPQEELMSETKAKLWIFVPLVLLALALFFALTEQKSPEAGRIWSKEHNHWHMLDENGKPVEPGQVPERPAGSLP